MAEHARAFRRRLSKVRRRWKAASALDGLFLVGAEGLGLFMLFVLADAIYRFNGAVRLGMLGAGLIVLAVLFVRHVVRPILRRIPDEQIALYIEERSPVAEGSVVSALECQREPRGGLSGFIAGFLMDDAVRRIDGTSVRVFANLGRLRKHLAAACVLFAIFAITTASFPKRARQGAERIIRPWESILSDQMTAQLREEAETVRFRRVNRRIEFDVQPKGMAILRGKGIEFTVALSRRPEANPVFHYQFARAGSPEQAAEMLTDQARYGYRLPFRDINEPFTYYVTAANQASRKYEIKVYDPLAVRGIELTYHYPTYLGRDPRSAFGPSGDVTALAGTRVDVKIVANNPLKAGTLTFDGGATVAMKPGAKAQDGATASFTVEKDTAYAYEITDVYGATFRLDDFFFVKAVPDKPPSITMVAPKVDMSVHPLCELTFAAKVADDFAIREAVARLSYYRGGQAQPMPLELKPTTQEDFRNFLEGRVEHVLELETVTPRPKVGDMVFYYMEVVDRKGQSVKTDVFFIKLMPFEVAAAWPEDPSPPDLPHWDYLWTPDIILLAAAAWHIEQQRGTIPVPEFQAKCTQLAGRMEPALNSQEGLNLLGGSQRLPRHILEAAADILAQANAKLETALGLLRQYEPGKAALEMQQAMALAESVNVEKALQELEMAQTPIHTGQPSGGYNQDTVMEQAEFRLPGVMSDSLTAFQQEDNPRHFLPPDYRRALRLKERTAPLTKELKLAGEIYASQEQLLEMAREQFGHRKLREAAEMSATNDPAAGSGTKAQMIRVDKRAVPWASMDPGAEMPPIGNRGEMKQPKVDRLKGLQYAKLRDNERAGPGNPHRSQTPGGGASGDEDDEPETPRERRKSYYDEQWKVEANDRRPRRSQGGGGGGGQQQQPPQMGMDPLEQQQASGGSSSAAPQLAARQAALAQRAAQLARGMSSAVDPDNVMGQRAATGVREASREMRRAGESFRRGDLRTGIAQARRAQQAMRTAMHGMRAAQFGTLDQALAAAQQGAAALVQNQRRISQGTERLEQHIRELSGETPAPQPGTGQPGKAEPGRGQPGRGQPGQGQPGKGQDAEGQPGKGPDAKGQPGKGEPGKGQDAQGQPGKGEAGEGEPGKGQHTKGQPSAVAQGRPGQGEPGQAERGGGQPMAGPSQGAVAEAKARDPRVAARMRGLAGEQLTLSESLRDFEGYVGDLTQWAEEAEKDRVTTSLEDVTDGLKQGDVAQKMIDAGVDLSQDDIGSARATQAEIEGALGAMTTRLREASDMLAGSKTGILSRTAREAKEVGRQVRELAGLPQRGGQGGPPSPGAPAALDAQQPGQGQPGQGQPTPGQPGRTAPGGGRPGEPEDSLAQRLADEQRGEMAMSSTPGRPGPGRNVPGGTGSSRDEIDDLWVKARDLADTLRDEQLADQAQLDYIGRRVEDPKAFRRMFDKVRQAEAGRFADVVTGVGRSLDEVLKETLSAKKLHAEQRQECPPQYRAFVDGYFETLSRRATGKTRD